jgi:hypothetical protein
VEQKTYEIIGTVDTKMEEEGVWFEHAPEEGEPGPNQIEGFRHLLLDKNGNGFRRVKVTSRYTKAYEDAEDTRQAMLLRKPLKKRLRANRRLTEELTGSKCITDWDFTDANGNAIPLEGNRQLAIDLMQKPQYRHHKFFVSACVQKVQGDVEEAIDEDEQD